MFSQGQLVVYPAHGVGVIEGVEDKKIGDSVVKFYVIRINSTGITVFVPVDSCKSLGLRKPCSVEEANRIIELLKDRSSVQVTSWQNWNRRQREYSERLKSSSLEDVACIVKEIIFIGIEKELSFGEKRLLEQALSLIVPELSVVLNKNKEEMEQFILDFYKDVLPNSKNSA